MQRLLLTAALALASTQALAVGRLADVTILDRDTGRVLTPYYHRGEYWVAGTPGDRYSISVHNRLGGRVLAIMAVDGVNVVSGETASWDQTGYVFGAEQAYDITGWRKSNAEVAAFTFAAAPDSYAARTGRPVNVGVIGVAVFREREPPRPVIAPRPAEPQADASPRDRAQAAAGAPATKAEANARLGAPVDYGRQAPTQSLGTGHGERESSYVEHTEFARRSNSPDEIIRIRYDSRENLVALGVIRAPLAPRPGPNAFPASPAQAYVPDPPSYPPPGLR